MKKQKNIKEVAMALQSFNSKLSMIDAITSNSANSMRAMQERQWFDMIGAMGSLGGPGWTGPVVGMDLATGTATATPPVLARKKLDAPKVDPFTETERDVFSRAATELGYKRPLLASEKPLYRALDKLGIEPFDMATVTAYKASKESRGFLSSSVWARVPLPDYKAFVPEFAIQRALNIKRECPEATFDVDTLVSKPDPFLIAKCGDETFYVDVWDEPDFHAKRAK